MVCSVKRIPVQRAGRALITRGVRKLLLCTILTAHPQTLSLSTTGGDLALCMIKIRLQRDELWIVAYAARIVFERASHPSTTMLQPQAYHKSYKDRENDILAPSITTLGFSKREMAEAIAREIFTRCELPRPWTKEENTVKFRDGQTKGTATEDTARQCNLQRCNNPHDSDKRRPRK